LRAHYPQAPHLADMVTLQAMQASFAEPRSPAEQAAHEAMDMLKAAIIDGTIPLHGCLPGELCGDIGPAEITIPGRIDVFGNTLHVRQGRTYHDVTCAVADIAALVDRVTAAPIAKDRPAAVSPEEACRALIEAHKNSDRLKTEIEIQARSIPGFLRSTFDSMWRDYASPYQKRQGRRLRSTSAG
jgi:hypothetical protein